MSNCNDRFRKWCKVCGDQAFSFNFAGLCCESCKIFFRRNASKEKTLQCIWRTETCQIDVETRKHCSKCRLRKCFEIGMKIRHSKRGRPRSSSCANDLTKETASSDENYSLSCDLLSAHIEMLFRSIQSGDEVKETEEKEEKKEDNISTSKVHRNNNNNYETHCLSVIRRLHLLFGDQHQLQPQHISSNFATDLTTVFTSQLHLLECVAQLAKSTFGFAALPLTDQVTLFKRAFPAIFILRSAYYYNSKKDAFALKIESDKTTENKKTVFVLVPLKLLYGKSNSDNDGDQQVNMVLSFHRWLAGEVKETITRDIVLRDLLAILLLFKHCDADETLDEDRGSILMHIEVVRYQYAAYCHLLWKYLGTVDNDNFDSAQHQQRYDRLLELVSKITAFKSAAANVVKQKTNLQAVEPILKEIYFLNDNKLSDNSSS